MSDQQYNDEIDLGVVFSKIKEGFKSFLVFIFNTIQFFIKYAILILSLIVVGVIAGYFLNQTKKPLKQATLIVHNNYGSTSYVYSAIELLNSKISENDTIFLKENGFTRTGDELLLLGAEITPIVNVVDLISRTQVDPRSLEAFFNELKYEEDLLSSEAFYTEYEKHKINLIGSEKANDEVLNDVLRFLSSNKHLVDLKQNYIDDVNSRLNENEAILSQIDSLINNSTSTLKGNLPSTIYIDSQEDVQTNNLINSKREIIKENESLRSNLIRNNEIILLLNNPKFTQVKEGLSRNFLIMVPLLLLIVFIGSILIIQFYNYLKKLASEQK